MLAAMFYAPLDVRMEQRPLPEVGPGEILLQVAAATTCGTDVKTYRRGHPVLFRYTPAGFGHEVAGIVAAVGKDVTRWREGDRLVVANSAPCLHCFYCRHQQYSLCEDLLFLNGAYAEYLLIPERIVLQNVYAIPSNTSFVAAALSEPLACAIHGVDACHIQAGDTVTVLGAGPLGLLLVAMAKLQGARVVLTGHNAERLALGARFGADIVLDVSSLSLEEQRTLIIEQTDGQRGSDVVIEAVGLPEIWQLATRIVRPGGLVNFFGGCASGTSVTLETQPIHYGAMTMIGVFHHTPTYFARAVDLIVSHQIDIEAMVTAQAPLAALPDILERLCLKQGVKYAILPPDFISGPH